jgi:hypothetical protein
MENKDKPELGGIFVWIGAIAGLLTGIEAGANGEDALIGGIIGFVMGAGIGRIVERVVFKLLIWAFFMLRVYLSLKSWGMLE